MPDFTPGPWRPGYIDHWERGEKIAVRAECVDGQPYIAFLPDLDGNVEANACLVAASPTLLAACEAAHARPVGVRCNRFRTRDPHGVSSEE